MEVGPGEITTLLRLAVAGDAAAHGRLAPLIYANLHRLARNVLAGERTRTLDTTALVHEVYLKLIGQEHLDWPDRRHFFGYVARAMRNLVVDDARRRQAAKHGGNLSRDEAGFEQLAAPDTAHDLLVVDQIIGRVASIDPRLGEVVELHVFAGLAFPEIAQCLDISLRTAMRDWQKARALCASLLAEHP